MSGETKAQASTMLKINTATGAAVLLGAFSSADGRHDQTRRAEASLADYQPTEGMHARVPLAAAGTTEDYIIEVGPPASLREAQDDLDKIARTGHVSERVLDNARTILPKLHGIAPVRYSVAETERGGIALDIPIKNGASVGVECGEHDVVHCFAVIRGNSRRAKFFQMDGLPDPFIAKALRDAYG